LNDTETSTVFAGIDGRTDATLPTWYEREHDPETVRSLAEAIRSLPRAVDTRVAFKNPYSDEWVATNRFNALVEPNRLVEQAGDGETDPLFHIPTSNYSIINPFDVYGPLESVIEEHDVDGRPLGEVVFGEIRQYRGGGEVHIDLMFDGLEVSLPGRDDPITMGVTTGYDFFGGHAVYVEGFARDSYCANSIRSLTDRQIVKHVGEVGDFEGWWENVLGQLELVTDDLHGFIVDASDIDLSFGDAPFGVAEFYELLGFPEYLAEHAARDARAEADDPFEIDMWTLHSGATHALTHFFRGREGSSLDEYVRAANDILFNPEATLDRVKRAYERQAEAETDGEQTGLESQVALAQLERVSEDVREKASSFESREERLRERFAAVSGD
jgi:uncharacterized protein YukE